MPHHKLSRTFLQSLSDPVSKETELEPLLDKIFKDCKAAWPSVSLDPDVFMRYLAERVPRTDDLANALSALHVSDLYLACACIQGIKAAIERFDELVVSAIPQQVGSLQGIAGSGEEIRQMLRAKLLVGETGHEALVTQYSGRGALVGWIRVAAMRTALNLRRAEQKMVSAQDDDFAHVAAGDADPELLLLKARYRQEFEQALREAVQTLSEHQKTLLRLSLIEGMSLEAISALYRVHLSTISRRMTKAREKIAEETHRLLRQRLKLSASELASLQGLVVSQLNAGISSILGQSNKK